MESVRTPKTGFGLVAVSYLETLPQGDLGGAPVLSEEPVPVITDAVKGGFRLDFDKFNFHTARAYQEAVVGPFGNGSR